MKEVLIYLMIINIVGFFIMGFDKSQARKNQRRVPEKRLFMVAALGGAVGSLAGMRVFRHKTKHKTFTIGIPSLLLLNILCTVYYFVIVMGH